MNFYETPALVEGETELKQGDIVFPVPFLAFSLTESLILFPDSDAPKKVDLTEASELKDGSQILANITSSKGIILNQSCDITGSPGRQKPVVIARILPWEERIKGFKANDMKSVTNTIRELANPGRRPSIFYLPEYEDANFKMPKSIVDILEVVCLAPSNVVPLKKLIKLRLNPVARQALQERLAYCFGRFGAPDNLFFNDEEWKQLTQK